jgi:hypothetical protein
MIELYWKRITAVLYTDVLDMCMADDSKYPPFISVFQFSNYNIFYSKKYLAKASGAVITTKRADFFVMFDP